MTLPGWLRRVLPADTALRWEQLREVVPLSALLVGGTGLAAHVQHRVSRDLNFFLTESFDAEELAARLSSLAPFAVTLQDEHSLNGILGQTKVQFLEAVGQRFVEPPVQVAGLTVAGIGDLLATKLKVIQDRGEHRDYFDLKVIEQRGGRDVETGLLLFTQHYPLQHPEVAVVEVVRGLGYHGDLDEDPGVPEALSITTGYWEARTPQLLASLDRTATTVRPRTEADLRYEARSAPPRPEDPGAPSPVVVEGYTRTDGTYVHGYIRRR
ncbi:MAG: nucleotidyl transferase AbiEii/AbiGii toxin family protein [Mycobacteriales bacterium]